MKKSLEKTKALLNRNKTIVLNYNYLSILEVFSALIPLLTYPYLINILGSELYGLVITAQIISSYCGILVNFGFKRISARDVAKNKGNNEKLSEVLSSIFIVRSFALITSFIIYVLIIQLVDDYREHSLLFYISFFLVLDTYLFPQYYFQGIERMKVITIITVISRSISAALIFIVIKHQDDYLWVPIVFSLGYLIRGLMGIFIILKKHKLRLYIPPYNNIKVYMKDASPLLLTEAIASIKDKSNYILLGKFIGMKEVVIYDLGVKLMNIMVKPITVLSTVLFPRTSREQNTNVFWRSFRLSSFIMIFLIALLNLTLDKIVFIFLKETINLFPLRLFSIAPFFLALSSLISTNIIIAFNKNVYILYSILLTTSTYLLLVLFCLMDNEKISLSTFIGITILSYLTEFIYRLIISIKITKSNKPAELAK